MRALDRLHLVLGFGAAVMAGACGDGTEPRADPEVGGGGSATGVVGEGGTGGDPGVPRCDCSLVERGCGSRLVEAAAEAGCDIPMLVDHPDDVWACAEGVWSVAEACPDGCELGGDESGDSCVAGLPVVEMDWLVLQAQVEPFRGDQPTLPGDAAVELVQAALADEGFAVSVDGWFGNETADRYADWQKQLGYTGLGANGIPGPSSLAALGEDRFTIVQLIAVGAKTTYTGRTVNQRTKDMLTEAEALLGFPIQLSQGSYNPGGVGASAGTHDGGGTVDVSVSSLTMTKRWQTVKAMRTVGFAAWLRNPSQGDWPYHIHAVAVGDTDMSISARNQVADYYVGKNGLASHAADDTPSSYQVPFTWWEQYLQN
ncbi:MAG: peptidoglycan-binding protein [Myxococcales bacterium]|nr:peptidoglycan-binding protein [Myxococcales bacterium]